MRKPTHVLIIDDDKVFCQLLENGLKRLGYSTSSAHNAFQALSTAEPVDIILLDMRLGNESGLGLIEPLIDKYQSAKIIVVTGYASLATAVDAVKRGVSNYIAKPIDVESVHKIIQDSLDDGDSEALTLGSKPASIPARPPSLKRLEWEHIQRVLEENQGNISQTAKQLGMHRRTLQRKLKKHAPQERQAKS